MVFTGVKERDHSTSTPLGAERVNQMWNTATALQRFTRQWTYEAGSAFIIVANAMFVAAETQHSSRIAEELELDHLPQFVTFTVLSLGFSFIFAVDLVLRLAADPPRFLTGRERSWNIFDAVVVLTGIFDALTSACGFHGASSLVGEFSVLRIIRLLRVIRMNISTRLLFFIKKLRLMVFSLSGAVRALVWAVVLVSGILLVFGVFFTNGTVAFCVNNAAYADDRFDNLIRYFGTLHRSMLTLLMAMSGGDDWINIFDALQPLTLEYRLMFLFFVISTLLAFLNIITAVFIDTAMKQSNNDKEMMVQVELAEQEKHMSTLRAVYRELDMSKNDEVSFDEFHKQIHDDRVQAYLQKLELDASHVQMLFKLLDSDNSGGVEPAEFVHGCMRLRGPAKAVDVAFLTSQIDEIHETIRTLIDRFPPPPSIPSCRQAAASLRMEEIA